VHAAPRCQDLSGSVCQSRRKSRNEAAAHLILPSTPITNGLTTDGRNLGHREPCLIAAVALAYPISMGRDAGVSVRVIPMRYLERPRG
jgi:hypothetical protein